MRGITRIVPWTNPLVKAIAKSPSKVASVRRVPDGIRVYCIGGIHGRDDLLREMADHVGADNKAARVDNAVTVFLGDYVDRGGAVRSGGRSATRVLGSLLLSMVTGPNEGYVRAERGILGASIWENLSPELKRRAANDLTAAEIIDNARFRAVLRTKSETVRNDLRTALLATGLSTKEIEQRLGF